MVGVAEDSQYGIFGSLPLLNRWCSSLLRKEPLRRTHECVFGVLALESEPIDPRL